MQILCQGHLSPWLEEATTLSDEGYGVARGRGIKEQQLEKLCVRSWGHGAVSPPVPSLTLLSHVTWVIPTPHPPHPRFLSHTSLLTMVMNEWSVLFSLTLIDCKGE